MNNSFTEEQFIEAIELWNRCKEEYEFWVARYGKPHLDKWYEYPSNPSIVSQEFAYYMVSRFREWKESKIESV